MFVKDMNPLMCGITLAEEACYEVRSQNQIPNPQQLDMEHILDMLAKTMDKYVLPYC